MTLTAGKKDTIQLLAQQVLTVTTDGLGDARVWRQGAAGYTAVGASATGTVGPFSTDTVLTIECLAGSLEWSQARYDFSTVAENDTRYAAAIPFTDFVHLAGSGAPVDYTDGDPAATGEGVAAIGSFYTDTATGNLYVNTGTKAEPIWQQLAFVA